MGFGINPSGCLLGAPLIQVRDRDRRPLAREDFRRGEPDATAASRHNGAFSGKTHFRLLWPSPPAAVAQRDE